MLAQAVQRSGRGADAGVVARNTIMKWLTSFEAWLLQVAVQAFPQAAALPRNNRVAANSRHDLGRKTHFALACSVSIENGPSDSQGRLPWTHALMPCKNEACKVAREPESSVTVIVCTLMCASI